MLIHILFTVCYENKQAFCTWNADLEEILTDPDADTDEFGIQRTNCVRRLTRSCSFRCFCAMGGQLIKWS